MLVPRMFRNYDSYIVPSATTGIATCKRSSDYQVPNHDRYATRIEEMTNTNSSIKVETCDVFKLIINTINILVEYIPPINLYWWNKFHRSPVPEYRLRGIFSTDGTFSRAAGHVFIEKRPGIRFRQVSPHSVVTKEGDRTAPGQFWQLSYSPI